MGTHDGEGVVATAYEHNTGSYTETTSSGYSDKRTSKCRDPIFALLFVINVVGIIATASAYGKKAFDDDDDIQSTLNTAELKGYLYMTLGCSGGAVVVTMAMFAIMMCIPQFLIKLAGKLLTIYPFFLFIILFYNFCCCCLHAASHPIFLNFLCTYTILLLYLPSPLLLPSSSIDYH